MEIAVHCREALILAKRLAPIGNKHVLSDIIVAAHLGFAAVNAALANVDIKVKSLKDGDYADACRKQRAKIAEDAAELHQWLIENVTV